MRVRCTLIFMILAMALGLSGCGQIAQINLTEEEQRQVADYAASVLTKYDKNHATRLVDTSKTRELEARVEAMKKINALQEETKVSAADGSSSTEGQPAPSIGDAQGEQDLAAIFGMPGFSVSYRSCEVTESYGSTDSMVLDADSGKQLMVFHFDITNNNGEAAEFNALDLYPSFRIIVNGSNTINALSTILDSDLASVDYEMEAGEVRDAVVIISTAPDFEKSISSVSLMVKYGDQTSVIPLN